MRSLMFLIGGALATLPPSVMAQEASAPSKPHQQEQSADKKAKEQRPASKDLPEELEEIRRALGPAFSVDSQQFDLPYHQPRLGSATKSGGEKDEAASPNSMGKYRAGKQEAFSGDLEALGQEFRVLARRLEALAAEAEERQAYPLADRLREIARRQWQSGREILGPVPISSPYSNPGIYSQPPSLQPPSSYQPKYGASSHAAFPPPPVSPPSRSGSDWKSSPWLPSPQKAPQVDGDPQPQ